LQVWAVDLDCGGGDVRLLSTRERARAGRLKRPDERRRSLEAHCAVRRILAFQLGVDPGHLEGSRGNRGRIYDGARGEALPMSAIGYKRSQAVQAAKDRSL
jgi:hypothetical protein